MPLREGNSAAIKSQNIREFHTGKTYAHTKAKFGKKRADAQAIAVALSTARKYRRRADGGSDDQGRELVRSDGMDNEPSPATGFGAPMGIRQDAIPPSLRDRAIGVAQDWLDKYGHLVPKLVPGANIGYSAAKGAWEGVKGLMDTNREAVDLRRKAETMPGSEEEIYLANLEAQNKERELAGQGLQTALGATAAQFPFVPEGSVGAFGGKPPPAGKFFHPYDLDPAELKGATQVTGQKGSNPGGTYQLASGEPVYIKTPKTVEHTYNEKLAAELYKLAGVPVADVKMTKFNGQPSIVSPIIPGKVLKDVDPGSYSYTSDLGQHHPADLWLGNYDWVGTGKDNIIVDPTGKAHRIDTGGALRFRAQGALKGPDMWGPEVKPFDLTKSPDMADVMDFTPKKWEQPTAQRVAQITDDQIKGLVDKYGPLAKGKKEELANTLIARRDGIAKMYGVGEEPPQSPPAPQEQFKQEPFDLNKSNAEYLMKANKGDPIQIAHELWYYAHNNGADAADAVVKHLPQDMWGDIDAHLSQMSQMKGHDPWQAAASDKLEDQLYAKWGHRDEPASEPPMGPEGWGSEHNYSTHEGDFKFTPEPHWWDALGKYGTIHTPEKPPGGWTEEALSNVFKDKRFARVLSPQEWQNWTPPTTGPKKFPIPEQADPAFLAKARALGANTNFVIAKGYSKHLVNEVGSGMESNAHGFEYPKEIENPKSKSHGYSDEHANYFADAPQIANSYGQYVSAPYFMIARNPLEVYYPAIRRATPAKTAKHGANDGAEYSSTLFTQMIHAAHANGHDWLILHGVNDSGGGNHTQYLMLNHKGTVRGIRADLDPKKAWSPRPLDALVAAPVGYGAYKTMNQKDEDE